jgi:glycerate-2-kinase
MLKMNWSREIMDTKGKLISIFTEAVKSVSPAALVGEHMGNILSEYKNGGFSKFIVTGFGKASYQMAYAVEEAVGSDLIKEGIIITKYGHAGGDRADMKDSGLKKIRFFEAGHPIPDKNGIKATELVIDLLNSADYKTLVLCLVSGGGSALFVSPYEGITLRDKQTVTELLIKSGADITELNSVRKHISRVKGGRLAEIASPARIISLIISDVLGDRLDVIASGTVSPDDTTFSDALDVIYKYNLSESTPGSIMDTLLRGKEGMIPETPDESSKVFENVSNFIIGNNLLMLNAARDEAGRSGFSAEITSSDIAGEARDVGKQLAEKAKGIKDQGREGVRCLISGGETTVKVTGSGKGGRNTELALSFAKEIEGLEGITLLSAGTDGTDGPTDAAGAIVDGETVAKAKALGLYPETFLDKNDSYHFFKETGSLLVTGPTGTNVMDIQIMLIE